MTHPADRASRLRRGLLAVLPAVVLGMPAAAAADPVQAAAGGPTLAWRTDLPGVIGSSSPAAADLDGDGSDEVLVAGYDGHLRAFHADGRLMWDSAVVPPSAGGPVAVDSAPTVVDLDHDGRPEVLVGAGSIVDPSQQGGMVVFNSDGSVRWKFEFNDIFGGETGGDPNGTHERLVASPVVGDVNGDGSPDIVAASQDNRVWVLTADGRPLPGWGGPSFYGGPGYWVNDAIFSTPVVFDGDGDGKDEIYLGVTGAPMDTVTSIRGGSFMALEMEGGEARLKWIRPMDDVFTSSPAVGDIDGDGRPELITGSGIDFGIRDPSRRTPYRVFAFHGDDGSDVPGWPVDVQGVTYASVAVADVVGDAQPEVIAATNPYPSGEGHVYVLGGDGSVKVDTTLAKPGEGGGGILAGPIVADLDGDGDQDIVAANGWAAFTLTTDGRRLWDPLEIGWTSHASPVVLNTGGGGRTLVIPSFRGDKGHLAAYTLPRSSTPAGWPMFRRTADRLGAAPGTATSVSIESTPSGKGYWRLDAAGGVTAFGDAKTFAGRVSLNPGERAASLSATPRGNGYWIFTNRGRALPFGAAESFGDLAGTPLNGPVLGSRSTPTGKGYYMVASDGGVFAFGDAVFRGSTGDIKLNSPVTALVPDPDGVGYWLVARDGGVFSFDAGFRGSLGGIHLNKPVSGMVPYGNGYVLVAEDGGAFVFSDRAFSGSLGDNPPKAPVVSITSMPVGDGYWMLDASGVVRAFGQAKVYS